MGRGSVDVSPGREVCLNPAGCGSALSSDSTSSLQLQGPDLCDGISQTRLVSAEPRPNSVRAMGRRLLGWISRAR